MARSRFLNAAAGLAALVGAASSGPAFATTYDFSYNSSTAATQARVPARSPEPAGWTSISVTSVLGMSLNGSPLTVPFYAYSYTPAYPGCSSVSCFSPGGAIVSNNSSISNFLFSAASVIEGEWPWPTFFYVIQPWANNGPGRLMENHSAPGGSYIDLLQWAILPQETSAFPDSRIPSSSAAPEPPTWAMMLVEFAGLGYAGLRQTRKSPRFV